jgi:hypothetical protein
MNENEGPPLERAQSQEPAQVVRFYVYAAVAVFHFYGMIQLSLSLIFGSRMNHLAHDPFIAVELSIAIWIAIVIDGYRSEIIENPLIRDTVAVGVVPSIAAVEGMKKVGRSFRALFRESIRRLDANHLQEDWSDRAGVLCSDLDEGGCPK